MIRGHSSPHFFREMTKIILGIFWLTFAHTSVAASDHSQKMSWIEFRNHFITEICSSKPKRMKAVLQELGSFTVANQDSKVIADRTQWATDLISGIQKKRFRCSKDGKTYLKRGDKFLDPVTMAEIQIGDAKYKAPFVHLPVRPTLETILATSKLINSFKGPGSLDLSQLALLEKKPDFINTDQMAYLLKSQLSDSSRERLVFIRAFKMLKSKNIAEVSEALRNLSNIPSRKTLTAITKVRKNIDPVKNPELMKIADDAIAEIEFSIQIGKALSIVYSGLSYSSILFLASIGLAIVFGLMGVINLAQGELIMIGAYVTFVIQECLAAVFPSMLPLYLLISIPFVFLITGCMGALIEFSVIRHLYTRPLMTLLATWGVSIFLINMIRVSFGTQNLEFYVPDYLVGGLSVFGDFLITWNRLATIIFAIVILICTLLLVKKTRFGMNIRAVTENRSMAGAIGVNTRKVDLLSFAVGSGLAGLAGLALSTIYNVNPTMGTNFIVDAFMVVVLGGVGSIWGTVFAALFVGMINVAVEPLYGAVAAKVLVMVLIIAVIQVRPEGIFTMKVRK